MRRAGVVARDERVADHPSLAVNRARVRARPPERADIEIIICLTVNRNGRTFTMFLCVAVEQRGSSYHVAGIGDGRRFRRCPAAAHPPMPGWRRRRRSTGWPWEERCLTAQ